MCFVMIDDDERRRGDLFFFFSLSSLVFLSSFASFSVDFLVHFCSPKKNKNLSDKSPLVVITESDQFERTIR